jgi:hypothetical protein
VIIYNLAFDKDRYSKSSVARGLRSLGVGEIMAETVELIRFKNSRAVVRASHMDMGRSGDKVQFEAVDRIAVKLIPNMHSDTNSGPPTCLSRKRQQ